MAGAEARIVPLPAKIGRHAVVGYIATGGMAELFLGKEPTGRPVVIKRILPHLARQTSFVSMFIDEARIGSHAKHPNLVEVYELGQVGTDLFLVMEYLVGENLAGVARRLTKRRERMSYGLCAYIIAEVCDGLHAAHELTDEAGNHLELVHRDVSPQNVFVTYGGDVKLLDFGVATAAHRLTQTASGEVKGKYAYMSPEQCRGEPLDRRSDIFSLGTVLYELTTLRRLFKRANELQVMKAITEEPIPRPTREIEDYPSCLEDICVRALARDPAQRYATAAEMREDLLRAMQQLGLEGDPHEAIASKFARLFSDRMVQKRELMERVRRGGDLGELLAPEVDEQVEVPIVSHVDATSLSRVRGATTDSGTATRRRRRAVFLVAFFLAILVGAGVGALLRLDRGSSTAAAGNQVRTPAASIDAPSVAVATAAPENTATANTATGAAATAGSATAGAAAAGSAAAESATTGSATVGSAGDVAASGRAPEPTPPPPPPIDEYIVISIDTEPAGVKVKVDGEDRGATPLDVRVRKGETTVAVELLHPGFTTASQQLVPDRDQRLYFALAKQARKIVPVKKPPKKQRERGGFRRFD